MYRLLRIVFLVFALVMSALSIPQPTSAASCTYVLGFKALHALIPAVVGDCRVDEHHNPTNGDGLQETTGGLLVWRKADNWTAFTDGYRTWINGPNGLQERLNTQRFSWEADHTGYPLADPAPITSTSSTSTSSSVTSTGSSVSAGDTAIDSPTALCRDGTYSYSAHHQGTCSWHGGVAVWYR